MGGLKIEIVNTKLIKPCNPTPEHLKRYSLSVFDEMSPPMYFPVLYYYLPEEENGKCRNDEKCHKLEKSLSQILTKYYHLAGRYMEDEFCIHCEDQGVECIEAQVNAQLSHFLQPITDLQVHDLSQFLPWDVTDATPSSIRSLVAVQINSFDCGGIILGIYISHIVADAFTLAKFMNGWAETSRTGTTQDLCHSFDHLSSLFPGRNYSLPKARASSANGLNVVVTKMFWFEETEIASIKESLVASDGRFSKVVVVIAMIWKALLEVSLAKHGSYRDSVMFTPMNLRGKSKVATPTLDIACGNFISPVKVLFKASKGNNVQMRDLMILLRSDLEKERARFEEATADDILSMFLKHLGGILQGGYAEFYVCSSWCKFPLYEADFGWGKPHWVSDACRDSDGINLMDSNTGGIQAFITLKEEDMNIFQQNLGVSAS